MKTITEITTQKRDAKRCNIYLDGEFFCGMQLYTVMKNRLKTGMQISEQQLNGIVMESEKETASQLAFNYVSRGMHTEKQVRDYLARKEFFPEIIDEIVNKLKGYGYVNDQNFATNYVSQNKGGKGKRLMSFELKRKGVSEKDIDEIMNDAPDEEDSAYRVTEKFMRNKELSFENFGKCYRRLVSKGFDYDVVKTAIDRFKRENEYSEN